MLQLVGVFIVNRSIRSKRLLVTYVLKIKHGFVLIHFVFSFYSSSLQVMNAE